MEDLLCKRLYQQTLINPLLQCRDLDELIIVSGYAASAMGVKHMSDMLALRHRKVPSVKLICGMAKENHIGKELHSGFLKLCSYPQFNFECRYLCSGEPVHSKVYVWCAKGRPVLAYAGSANYSQNAFRASNTRREVLIPCSEQSAFKFCKSLMNDTVDCRDDKAVRKIVGKGCKGNNDSRRIGVLDTVNDQASKWAGLPTIKASLLIDIGKRSGKIHKRGGLNWGQRDGRERNQAYIPLNSQAQRSGFFPETGEYFTVTTDDGCTFQCVRAQANGKAIETYGNNSELGKYFRRRLGVGDGEFVGEMDLRKYGRSDVSFYKLDEENFVMDFSV